MSMQQPKLQPTMSYAFDPDSPWMVAKGAVVLGVLGAITGSSIGMARAQNPVVLGMNMGLNGSIAGLSFFSIREYLISPLLTAYAITPYHTRRLGNLELIREGKEPIASTPHEVRTERLLDSGLAGGLAGLGLSLITRGRRNIIPTFITSALITTSLQYGANNIQALRLEVLLSRAQRTQQRELEASQPASETPSLSSAPSITDRAISWAKSVSPVRKISDEEYLSILAKQREELEEILSKPPVKGPGSSVGINGVGESIRQLDLVNRKIRQVEAKIKTKSEEEA